MDNNDIAFASRPSARGCPRYRIKRHSKRNMVQDDASSDARSVAKCAASWNLVQRLQTADPTESLSTEHSAISSISKDDEPTTPLSVTSGAWLLLACLWRSVYETLEDIGDELMPGLCPFEFDTPSAADVPPKT